MRGYTLRECKEKERALEKRVLVAQNRVDACKDKDSERYKVLEKLLKRDKESLAWIRGMYTQTR